MNTRYELFRKYQVKANSVEDFMARYYKAERYTGQGEEYARAVLQWKEETYAKDGFVVISHHDSITGETVAWYGPAVVSDMSAYLSQVFECVMDPDRNPMDMSPGFPAGNLPQNPPHYHQLLEQVTAYCDEVPGHEALPAAFRARVTGEAGKPDEYGIVRWWGYTRGQLAIQVKRAARRALKVGPFEFLGAIDALAEVIHTASVKALRHQHTISWMIGTGGRVAHATCETCAAQVSATGDGSIWGSAMDHKCPGPTPQAEAIRYLRQVIREGDTLYFAPQKSTAKYTTFRVYVIAARGYIWSYLYDGGNRAEVEDIRPQLLDITGQVARATGDKVDDKTGGIKEQDHTGHSLKIAISKALFGHSEVLRREVL